MTLRQLIDSPLWELFKTIGIPLIIAVVTGIVVFQAMSYRVAALEASFAESKADRAAIRVDLRTTAVLLADKLAESNKVAAAALDKHNEAGEKAMKDYMDANTIAHRDLFKSLSALETAIGEVKTNVQWLKDERKKGTSVASDKFTPTGP
jgi:hypothetical protein